MKLRMELTIIVCWVVATLSIALGFHEVVAIGFYLAGVGSLAIRIMLSFTSSRKTRRTDEIWETLIVSTVTAFLLLGVNFLLYAVSRSPEAQLYAAGVAALTAVVSGFWLMRFTKKHELSQEAA